MLRCSGSARVCRALDGPGCGGVDRFRSLVLSPKKARVSGRRVGGILGGHHALAPDQKRAGEGREGEPLRQKQKDLKNQRYEDKRED